MPEIRSNIQSGTCPKCGGSDIRYQHITWGQRNALPTSIWRRGALLDNYVCTHCGYLESYVQPKDIDLITKTWTSLQPTKMT